MKSFSSIIRFVFYKIHVNTRHFSIPYLKQHKYLENFNEPKSAIERSFFQYRCESFTNIFLSNLMKNFFSFLVIIPFISLLLLKKKTNIHNNTKYNAVMFDGLCNLSYNNLFNSFDEIHRVQFGKNYYLRIKDFLILLKVIAFRPFSPFWIIKNAYKIALYRFVIDRYDPNVIICASEYSFTSSLLTYYCEQNKIKHINIMHGEKFYFIRDAFFYFHQCYIWDTHYINLFKKLKAYCNEYIVYVPDNLKIEIKNDNSDITSETYKFTYYLGLENYDELISVRESLLKTGVNSYQIAIRFHPRYGDFYNVKMIYKIFCDFFVENPYKISLSDSISRADFVVSLYSTVLYQSYLSGKKIILDDVSFYDKYEMLKELDYIIFNKKHRKLSEFIH